MLKTWWNRIFARKSGPTKRIVRRRLLRFEPLEQRSMLSVTVNSVPPTWKFEGPTPTDPPPAFTSPVFGNGTVAYDPASDIIVAGSTTVGVGAQTVSGQATNWEKLPIPAGGPPPVGSPLGFPSGIVQIDTVSSPGNSIRYTTGYGLHSFTAQAFNSLNVPVPAAASTNGLLTTAAAATIPLNMPGSTDLTGNTGTLYSIDPLSGSISLNANFGLGLSVPYAVNTVAPNRMVIGTSFLYESTDNGQNILPLDDGTPTNPGLLDVTNLLTNQDYTIVNPLYDLGSVTALEYGGTNPGGTINPNLLWVGAAGGLGGSASLYLRSSGSLMPTAVNSYPGTAPQAIVSNPTNWQQTFVIDNFNVYETIDGGVHWTTITGNLQSLGLSSIAFMHATTGDYLAVGVKNIVYKDTLPKVYTNGIIPLGNWGQLGNALPAGLNPLAPYKVGSLQYNAAKDILVAGSNGAGNMGGSTWELDNASTAQPTKQIVVDGTGGTGPLGGDTVTFIISGGNLLVTDMTAAGPNQQSVPLGTISDIVVKNLGGVSTVILDFTNGNPLPSLNGATFTVNGNAGGTTITEQGNVASNQVLKSNTTPLLPGSLTFSTLNKKITLNNVGVANLRGVVGNTFDVSTWTGTGSLTGVGANSTVIVSNPANVAKTFTLMDSNLSVTGGPNMALTGIGAALLTGGTAVDTFILTGWTGKGTITGGGGADHLKHAGALKYSFSSTSFQADANPALTLAGIPILDLTGANAKADFIDNGITGVANLFATGGPNTLTSRNDEDFTLTGNNQITAGTGTINYNGLAGGAFTAITIGDGNAHTAHMINVGGYTNAAVVPLINAKNDKLTASVGGAGVTVAYTLDSNDPSVPQHSLNINSTTANVNFQVAKVAGASQIASVLLTGNSTAIGGNNFTVNAWDRPATLTATAGTSNFMIGNGDVNNITGKLNLSAPLASGKLTVDDSTYNQIDPVSHKGTVSYHITNSVVTIDTLTTPSRLSALGSSGVSYDTGINQVIVKGSAGNPASLSQYWNQYLVTPSSTTSFMADNSATGNPAKGFLGVVFLGDKPVGPNPTDTHRTIVGNNGSWTIYTQAGVQEKPVDWTNIAPTNMNGIGDIVLGGGTLASNTSQPIVQVYNAEFGSLTTQFLAYQPSFQLGIKVVAGGFMPMVGNSPLIATAPGRGIPGTVNFFTNNTVPSWSPGTTPAQKAATPQGNIATTPIGSFQPYGASYTNGINIAFGAYDPIHNTIDLIVAPQRGALPVKVYRLDLSMATIPNPGNPILSFMAYPAAYIGGVNVAGGQIFGSVDATGHPVTDVVTAPQSGMQATVEVWDGRAAAQVRLAFSFLAMAASFRGGVSLALGDVDGDGTLDIVTGAGSTGASLISVFNGKTIKNKYTPGASPAAGKNNTAVLLGIIGTSPTVNGALIKPFNAYTDSSNFAPVSVTLKDVDGDGRLEIITAQGTNGKSQVLRYWKVNAGGNPDHFQLPQTAVGTPPTPAGGLSIG